MKSRSEVLHPSLGQTLDFMRILWALDHALLQTSKRMEAALGITGSQRLAIRIIGRFDEVPAGEVARLLHLHPSTLTGILKRLEPQGLIRRRVDPHDGRRSLLRLTTSGRRFDVETEGTVEAAVRRALKSVPRTKIESVRELLERIATELGPDRVGFAYSGHGVRQIVEGGHRVKPHRFRARSHPRSSRGSRVTTRLRSRH